MKPLMKYVLCAVCAAVLMLGAAGCAGAQKTSTVEPGTLPVIGPDTSVPGKTEAPSPTADQTLPDTTQAVEPTLPSTEGTTEAPTETHAGEAPTQPKTTEAETSAPVPTAPGPSISDPPADRTNYRTEGTNGYVIVIDPGHQAKGNSAQEPVGPGASETKAKVSSGTASRFGGKAEYVVNLEVALKLRKELLSRGYTVIMTRTGHNVDISNVERAKIANDANADAFVRLHCNGSENASVRGIGIYYQTPSNPYNGSMHAEAKALCSALLNHMKARTGSNADGQGLFERDNYSGINWSNVPGALVEMGYMTNEAEDKLLQDGAYQTKLVLGMADGIDEFLSTRKAKNK